MVFLGPAFLMILAATVFRGIRHPNDWAEAHWLISYEFGFLKRALLGTLFHPIIHGGGGQYVEQSIAIVSSMFTLAFSGVILAMCLRLVRNTGARDEAVLFVVTFLTSPFVVMTGHFNGYFDSVMFLLCTASLVLAIRGRNGLAFGVLTVGVFVHETIMVVGFPALVLVCYARHRTFGGPDLKSFARGVGPLASMPCLALAVIAIAQVVFERPDLQTQLQQYLAGFDFVGRHRDLVVSEAFTTSFSTYLDEQKVYFWARLTAPAQLASVLFPLLILLALGLRCLAARVRSYPLAALVVASALLPLGLLRIAWDVGRIWSYSLVVLFMIVWAFAEVAPSRSSERTGTDRTACWLAIAVIFLQLFSRTPLLDGEVERFSFLARLGLYSLPIALLVLWRLGPPDTRVREGT